MHPSAWPRRLLARPQRGRKPFQQEQSALADARLPDLSGSIPPWSRIRDVFKKWRRRREEQRALQKRADAAEIANARREAEIGRDNDLSDVDKSQPIFRPTDWTGGGPP
jgi:hypothetical protein